MKLSELVNVSEQSALRKLVQLQSTCFLTYEFFNAPGVFLKCLPEEPCAINEAQFCNFIKCLKIAHLA